MISEELVASGGTHACEADMPEGSHKATATQQPRVSGAPGLPGLPWLFLPQEALGKWGTLRYAQEMVSCA